MNVALVDPDPLVRQVLENAIHRLAPTAAILSFSDLYNARIELAKVPVALLVLSVKLPDGDGFDLLKSVGVAIKTLPVFLLVDTIDRLTVMRAKKYGVNAILSKPFSHQSVLLKLAELLPDQESSQMLSVTDQPLLGYVAEQIECQLLRLPYDPVLEQEFAHLTLSTSPVRDLHGLARQSTALAAYLLAEANRLTMAQGQIVEGLPEAIKLLGSSRLMLVSQQLLLQRYGLVQPYLVHRARDFTDRMQMMAKTAYVLAKKYQADAEACYAACMMVYMGELAVLRLVQSWIDLGGPWSASCEPLIDQALAQSAIRAGNKIKVDLHLPVALRELSGAVHLMPTGIIRREKLITRLASLMNLENKEQEIMEIMRHLGGVTRLAAGSKGRA